MLQTEKQTKSTLLFYFIGLLFVVIVSLLPIHLVKPIGTIVGLFLIPILCYLALLNAHIVLRILGWLLVSIFSLMYFVTWLIPPPNLVSNTIWFIASFIVITIEFIFWLRNKWHYNYLIIISFLLLALCNNSSLYGSSSDPKTIKFAADLKSVYRDHQDKNSSIKNVFENFSKSEKLKGYNLKIIDRRKETTSSPIVLALVENDIILLDSNGVINIYKEQKNIYAGLS